MAAPVYPLGLNPSSSGIADEVQMAHDEIYDGPVAESLPSSVSSFSHHHRAVTGSRSSFATFPDDLDPYPASLEGAPDSPGLRREDHYAGDASDDHHSSDSDLDFDEIRYACRRRRSSQLSMSVRTRLLRRSSAMSASHGHGACLKDRQTIHMANDDITVEIAAYRTSRLGFVTYILICVLTLGASWLLLEWLPRWRVKVIGKRSSLRECQWLVVENSWKELAVEKVRVKAYGRPLSTVFGAPDKMSAYLSDDDPDPVLPELRELRYRYLSFYYDPTIDQFRLSNGWKDRSWTDVRAIRVGIDAEEKGYREQVFGSNLIDLEQKSVVRLLTEEIIHPFYIFQIASLTLWCLDEYYYYAVAIFVMSIGSIIMTLIETRLTMKRLREISRFECDVRVLRNGFWRSLPSSDLVPGDIYEISDPHLAQFPTDSVLLTGDCIVNESMLTGESVPVSKTPATDDILRLLDLTVPTMPGEIARHFLFCGTKIIRVRRPHDDHGEEAVALAMVARTGFNTTKGALVRSMLFPKPSSFRFYRDSFRYISVMACLAILGFIISLVNFVHLGISLSLTLIRALDLITIIVPPALPATLTIGVNFALRRLRAGEIFCISPQRVSVAGILDYMCFDKTGTLTEEGLDVLGVRVVSRATNKFGETLSDVSSLSASKLVESGIEAAEQEVRRTILHTMATCHSLRSVEGQLVGDPLDVKMFEFTKWSFKEGDKGSDGKIDDDEQGTLQPSVAIPPPESDDDDKSTSPDSTQDHDAPKLELGVLRSFEFVSNLRRASVIVRVFGQESGDIFVKGAPESMRDICRPESFPSDYDALLAQYTFSGYRVIACAARHVEKLSWVRSQKIKRHEAECDLDFVGLIIFENKLKPMTSAVLDELSRANIGSVMVTGDNILTAISVARECNLVNKTAHCFVPRFIEGGPKDPSARLQWESIDNSLYRLDERTLTPLPVPPEGDASLPYDISNLRNYSLALTGEVFRWAVDYATPETLRRMLVAGKVFARMSPDEKHELVEKLQSIDYRVGFCGDGANDCGALKAADVGISLSEAEASVAAPFTSRVFDIRCVPQVVREGRTALTTSFSCFKYMSLYSTIQFTSVSFLYSTASNLGDFQFLYIDLAVILPIAVFMSWAGPAPTLCPKRPISDLVSRKVLTPLFGQIILCIVIQACAFIYVHYQPWYQAPEINLDESTIASSDNTALFLISCLEYIFLGVVLNAGLPFRQRPIENWPFIATVTTVLAFTIYLIFYPFAWLSDLMELTFISQEFKFFILGFGLIYLLLAWTGERFIYPPLARWIGHTRQAITHQPKKRKEYKLIRESMRW